MDMCTVHSLLHPGNALSRCLVLLLVFLQSYHHVITGQRLPSRDEDHVMYTKRHRELFYDTRLLPDGIEMKLYLRTEQSYYFLVEEDDSPLTLIVTPCTTDKVSWRLLYQAYPSEDSDEEQEEDEMFSQGQSDPVSGRRVLYTTDISGVRTVYDLTHTIAGLYTLEFTPQKGAVSFKVFGSTSIGDNPYPELPTDKVVRLNKNGADRSVDLSWDAASDHGQPLEYCVAINNRESLDSQCAALAYKFGDRSPQLPPNVGFGFPGEKERFKRVNIKPKTKYDIIHTCIGAKTSFTFSNMQEGRKYYFNVYAVNPKTNSSSSYDGLRYKFRNKKTKSVNLKEGKLTSTSLGKDAKDFTFALRRRTEHLLITVQPCTGPIYVEISRNNKLVNLTTVRDTIGQLVFDNIRKGKYRVRIQALEGSTSVRLAYSTRTDMQVYPVMPSNVTLLALQDRVTCSSMSITWTAAQGNNQYCTYVHKANTQQSVHHQNWCISKKHRKKKHKVSCTRQEARGVAETMVQTISDLDPESQYEVRVLVSAQGRHWLPYHSVISNTLSVC